MSGDEEVIKSSKKSFMTNSPKPKQASILKFFGSQKQEVFSSPLSKVTRNSESKNLLEMKENNSISESDNFPLEFFDEPLDFSSNDSKKVCSSKKIFSVNVKSYSNSASTIITPKILNDLNEAVGTEFDQSENSCGRYSWLIDLKDSNGRKKGQN